MIKFEYNEFKLTAKASVLSSKTRKDFSAQIVIVDANNDMHLKEVFQILFYFTGQVREKFSSYV